MVLPCEKIENKQKESGFGPFLKMDGLYNRTYCISSNLSIGMEIINCRSRSTKMFGHFKYLV